MSVEQPRPRTETTFFPDPREQASIAGADVPTLARMYRRKPGMSGRFTHELWRNRRDDTISNLAAQGALTTATIIDMSESTIMMRVELGEPVGLAEEFVVDVAELIILGHASEIKRSPASKQLAEETMEPMLSAIDREVIRIQATLQDETKN